MKGKGVGGGAAGGEGVRFAAAAPEGAPVTMPRERAQRFNHWRPRSPQCLSHPHKSRPPGALFGAAGLRGAWWSEGEPGMRVACIIAAVSTNHRELRHDGFHLCFCRDSSIWLMRTSLSLRR